jgi:uncharacterized Rossmann fold enzyme
MLNVVAVNWKNYAGRGTEYANILFDSIRRNLPDGFAGRFIVFTDDTKSGGYNEGIWLRSLPDNLEGWFNKLYLFRPGLFPPGDRVLYLDLSILITGPLDAIAAYDGPFATLRDFYRPDGLQSAVMAWRAGDHTDIWKSYQAAGCPTDDPGGDQSWIERTQLQTAVRLQDVFPDAFVSYKLINGPPEKASIVKFHGQPKPHEITTGWVPEVWKIGGMTRAELDSVCNTAKEKLLASVRHATALDLRWFDTAPEHDGHVCIVGGGPSLADTLEELAWRKSIGQKVWALNGAARFLYKNGILPDAVVIADARAENASFLAELNQGVTAYLASQCDPALFEACRECELEIVLWHVNSPGMAEALQDEKERPVHLIGGGSTVGLNAMVLAFAGGFRKIHLYGFDSSYRDEQHHAYGQAMNDQDRVVDALYREQKFRAAPWMVQQVNEFQDLVPTLTADGCVITVAGSGLLPSVAKDMAANMPMTPAQQRAQEVLQRIDGVSAPHGAEIGVFKGDMSAALLRGNAALSLIMVDSWEGEGGAYQGNSGDWHANLQQNAQDEFMAVALDRVAFASDRAKIKRMRSVDAADEIEDHSLDFVFIDADHSYRGCRDDIEAWACKVKPGGWLCGHDYENEAFPKFGVTKAVNEYAKRRGLSVELGANYCWFLRMPEIVQEREDQPAMSACH